MCSAADCYGPSHSPISKPCYWANVSIASQCSQPISKLHQTHSLTPWITWQQFSSKQALSASFPFIILPSCIFAFLFLYLPLCLQAAMEMRALSCSFSPHFPGPAITDGFAELLRENSTLQQPLCICQGLSKGHHFTQHHCLLNWFNAIGEDNSLGIPGAWACCSPVWFKKALLNDKLPGYHKDFAANSPTRAKSTFSSEDAAYKMQ